MRDKKVFENEKYSVFESNKGYDFHYWVDNKKSDKDWTGFLYGEEEEFLVFCNDLQIELPQKIIDSINDYIESSESIEEIINDFDEMSDERRAQLIVDGWIDFDNEDIWVCNELSKLDYGIDALYYNNDTKGREFALKYLKENNYKDINDWITKNPDRCALPENQGKSNKKVGKDKVLVSIQPDNSTKNTNLQREEL